MRRRDERGAIAILAAATMVVVLGIAAFVIDLGMQRVARQDLQALADVVALDLARMLDGKQTAAQIERGSPSLEAATDASQARNDDDTVGDEDALKLVPTLLVASGDVLDPWRPADPDEVPAAVRVVAATEVAFGFAGVIGFESGGAERSAVATAESSACLHLGSMSAALRDDPALSGPLDVLLDLGLDAVQYLALAEASLSLDDLAEQEGVGSVERLLAPLPADELWGAVASALPPGPARQAATAAGAADGVDGLDVALGDVVLVSASEDAVRNATPVLDLVAPAMLRAAGPVVLGEDVLGTLGLDAVDTIEMSIGQGEQRVCTTDPVESSSIVVEVSGALALTVRGLDVATEVAVEAGVGAQALSRSPDLECGAGEDRYGADLLGGSSVLGVRSEVSISGAVTDQLPPGVDSVVFDDVGASLAVSDEETGNPSSPVELTSPDNAVNGDREAVPTGVAFAGFPTVPGVGAPVIAAALAADPDDPATTGGTIVVELDPDATEAQVEAAPRRTARLVQRRIRPAVNRALGARLDLGTVEDVRAAIAPYARLLGARRSGTDLYSEVAPTCLGVSLVE